MNADAGCASAFVLWGFHGKAWFKLHDHCFTMLFIVGTRYIASLQWILWQRCKRANADTGQLSAFARVQCREL